MKKKLLTLAFVGILTVSLVGCGTTNNSSSGGSKDTGAAKGNIRIGVVSSMTGPAALDGELEANGAKMAAEEINAAGGVNGRKLELVIEDSQTTNPGSVAAFQKVAGENVVAIVGPIFSTNVKAIMPYMEKYKIPVAVGGTDPSITSDGNPWVFRFRPSDTISTQVMAKFLMDHYKTKKVAIFNATDAFGEGGRKGLEASFQKLGIESKAFEFTSHSADYTAQLVNIKQFKPDAICTYIPYVEDCGILLNQARQMGIDIPIVGSPSLVSANSIELTKKNAEGIFGVTDYFPEQNDMAKTYFKNYKTKYGNAADNFSSYSYDAVQVLAKVIAKSGDTPQKIQEGLKQFKGWTGAEGEYDFTTNSPSVGDGLHSYTIVTIKDGKQQFVKVVTSK
ncbi:MAG: ABC transporter substrate-binding protein [Desulfitobacteriaceae bacterium]